MARAMIPQRGHETRSPRPDRAMSRTRLPRSTATDMRFPFRGAERPVTRRRLHRVEDLQIPRDLSRAVERRADRSGVRAALHEPRAIGAAHADRVGERLRIARLRDEA